MGEVVRLFQSTVATVTFTIVVKSAEKISLNPEINDAYAGRTFHGATCALYQGNTVGYRVWSGEEYGLILQHEIETVTKEY